MFDVLDVPEPAEVREERLRRETEKTRHKAHRKVCHRRSKSTKPTKAYGRGKERFTKRLQSVKRAMKFEARDEAKPIEDVQLITYEPAGRDCIRWIRFCGNQPVIDLTDTVTLGDLMDATPVFNRREVECAFGFPMTIK